MLIVVKRGIQKIRLLNFAGYFLKFVVHKVLKFVVHKVPSLYLFLNFET